MLVVSVKSSKKPTACSSSSGGSKIRPSVLNMEPGALSSTRDSAGVQNMLHVHVYCCVVMCVNFTYYALM